MLFLCLTVFALKKSRNGIKSFERICSWYGLPAICCTFSYLAHSIQSYHRFNKVAIFTQSAFYSFMFFLLQEPFYVSIFWRILPSLFGGILYSSFFALYCLQFSNAEELTFPVKRINNLCLGNDHMQFDFHSHRALILILILWISCSTPTFTQIILAQLNSWTSKILRKRLELRKRAYIIIEAWYSNVKDTDSIAAVIVIFLNLSVTIKTGIFVFIKDFQR